MKESAKAADRQRHYSWSDPRAHWSRLGPLSGLQDLPAVLAGAVPKPPIAIAPRLTLGDVAQSRVVHTGQPGEDFANHAGTVQGGWVAALIDAAIGGAAPSALPLGTHYVTIELKLNYVHAAAIDGGESRCMAGE